VAPRRLLVVNGTITTGVGPDPAAVRALADQLADLRREAQEIIPDLMGVLADAEQAARRIADK